MGIVHGSRKPEADAEKGLGRQGVPGTQGAYSLHNKGQDGLGRLMEKVHLPGDDIEDVPLEIAESHVEVGLAEIDAHDVPCRFGDLEHAALAARPRLLADETHGHETLDVQGNGGLGQACLADNIRRKEWPLVPDDLEDAPGRGRQARGASICMLHHDLTFPVRTNPVAAGRTGRERISPPPPGSPPTHSALSQDEGPSTDPRIRHQERSSSWRWLS